MWFFLKNDNLELKMKVLKFLPEFSLSIPYWMATNLFVQRETRFKSRTRAIRLSPTDGNLSISAATSPNIFPRGSLSTRCIIWWVTQGVWLRIGWFIIMTHPMRTSPCSSLGLCDRFIIYNLGHLKKWPFLKNSTNHVVRVVSKSRDSLS